MARKNQEHVADPATRNRSNGAKPKGRPGRNGNGAWDRMRTVICRPWGLRLLREVSAGPVRFNMIKHALTGINSKTLSAILRLYEEEGILLRQVMSTRPLAVKYSATPKGRSLRELMEHILRWQDSWEKGGER